MRKISIITKTFGKTVTSFLLDKVKSTNEMTFIDKEEIIMGDYNTLANNISDPVLKCVVN